MMKRQELGALTTNALVVITTDAAHRNIVEMFLNERNICSWPVSGLMAEDLASHGEDLPIHDDTIFVQWLYIANTIYRCGGSAGLKPASRLTELTSSTNERARY